MQRRLNGGLFASLYDAADDEIEGVLAGHVLFIEKPRGGALRLGEYRKKKLCARPVSAPPFCIVVRTLKHALKAGRPFRLAAVVDYPRFQVVVDIMGELVF